MRKPMAIAVIVSLLMAVATPVWAEAGTPLEGLRDLEVTLYGQVQEGALIERLARVEQDVFGEQKMGPILVRIENLNTYLMLGGGAVDSLQLKLNAIEWMVYQEIYVGEPLYTRLERLENAMYGSLQQGPVMQRADELLRMVWASDKLNVDVVTVPKETLVKIKLLTELDSAKSKVGDKVHYRVIEDVMIKDRLVILPGPKVLVPSRRLPRPNGWSRRSAVGDFKSLPAIDGTRVSLVMEETATEKNKSLEMAAGAGMAGVILLGPIGLAGAYFIKGKDVVITKGTEFYVEVMRDARASGLSLVPAR